MHTLKLLLTFIFLLFFLPFLGGIGIYAILGAQVGFDHLRNGKLGQERVNTYYVFNQAYDKDMVRSDDLRREKELSNCSGDRCFFEKNNTYGYGSGRPFLGTDPADKRIEQGEVLHVSKVMFTSTIGGRYLSFSMDFPCKNNESLYMTVNPEHYRTKHTFFEQFLKEIPAEEVNRHCK